MKIQNKVGFTLIELLVVITIIGILGTGAAAVYTSQIQKARDTTRITDVKALQSAIEQVYQDEFRYPRADKFFSEVSVYLAVLPGDSKHGETCNNSGWATDCGYAYRTWSDANGISQGAYEVSTAFESQGLVTSRASRAVDNGDDNARYEAGIWVDATTTPAGITTVLATIANPNNEPVGLCTIAWAVAGAVGDLIVINGNPSRPGTSECG